MLRCQRFWLCNIPQIGAHRAMAAKHKQQHRYDDQRQDKRAGENRRCVDKGIIVRKSGCRHKPTENDPALAGHKVRPAQCAIVHGQTTNDQVHAGAFAQNQGNRRHKGQNRVVTSPHCRNHGGSQKHRKRQKPRRVPAKIQKMPGQLFQGPIDHRKAVKQADRKDHKKDLKRPHRNDFLGRKSHDKAAQDIGKSNGKQADINPGDIAQENGQKNGQNNQKAHLEFRSSTFLSNPNRRTAFAHST